MTLQPPILHTTFASASKGMLSEATFKGFLLVFLAIYAFDGLISDPFLKVSEVTT